MDGQTDLAGEVGGVSLRMLPELGEVKLSSLLPHQVILHVHHTTVYLIHA